jgi:phosphomannomutase
MSDLHCFKSYDVRGRLGDELNPEIAYRIGRAFAVAMNARRVVLGRDCRASSAELMAAVADGLIAEGVLVLDLGLCGTEEMYHATTHFDADGGIEVTASHNPMDYNGMKMVGRGSAPLDPKRDFASIKAIAEANAFGRPRTPGRVEPAIGARSAYVETVLSFVDCAELPDLSILVNAGNGAAGPSFDAIADGLVARGARLRFIRMNHDPDGSFPNGIPNPLLPENQPQTARAVTAHGADLAVAWDGDFDRCFLFDHSGNFIPGEYVVGLLAEAFLEKEPGATIVHDPRVVWNTQNVIEASGGRAVQAKTGHAFLKQALRDTGAVYGGEMSAHHYFRDFMACDSGMIPWLLIAELIGKRKASLAALVQDRMQAFPSSGEINFRLSDPMAAIDRVCQVYAAKALARDEMDGLSLAFDDWRFNLRSSNTEPLLRLNVETRRNPDRLARAVADLSALIRG